MRIYIHSHTAPANYIEAIRRDPKGMGCRIEKDERGGEMVVQENGRSTRIRTNLIDPELRLREMAEEQIDLIVESFLPPLLPMWAATSIAVRVCQTVNDALAEDAARYPGRLIGMAIVPLQDVGEVGTVTGLQHSARSLGTLLVAQKALPPGCFFRCPDL